MGEPQDHSNQTVMAQIYIVYNADSTHNGLHLNETARWAATKKRIIGSDVQQLHRDELSNELKTYIDSEKLDLPVVLGQESTDAPLKVLMKKGELADCSKDHEKFLGALQKNASGEGIALNIQSKM